MSVSAIIVTRGDVDLGPILKSLPDDWEKLVWENGRRCRQIEPGFLNTRDPDWRYWSGGLNDRSHEAPNLSVYGRYAAIQYASHDLIYVQDDDCIVENPGSIVDAWYREDARRTTGNGTMESPLEFLENHLVANMPLEFRPHYPDSCLVGFGACFHRDLPARAFERYFTTFPTMEVDDLPEFREENHARFLRACDVVFTTLTPRVLVDVPVEVLSYAHDSNRMWKQPDHVGERTRVLEMARKVRDA